MEVALLPTGHTIPNVTHQVLPFVASLLRDGTDPEPLLNTHNINTQEVREFLQKPYYLPQRYDHGTNHLSQRASIEDFAESMNPRHLILVLSLFKIKVPTSRLWDIALSRLDESFIDDGGEFLSHLSENISVNHNWDIVRKTLRAASSIEELLAMSQYCINFPIVIGHRFLELTHRHFPPHTDPFLVNCANDFKRFKEYCLKWNNHYNIERLATIDYEFNTMRIQVSAVGGTIVDGKVI